MNRNFSNEPSLRGNYFQHDSLLQVVKALNLLIMTAVFAGTWYLFYADTIIDPFYNLGNWVVIGIFAVIYFFYGRTYDAFIVSLTSVSEKVYSQVLSCLFTDGIMYIIIGVLTRHVPNVLPLLGCLLMQAVCSYLWSVSSYKWYFKRYPARKTAIVYDEENNLQQVIGEHGLGIKFDVKKLCSKSTRSYLVI